LSQARLPGRTDVVCGARGHPWLEPAKEGAVYHGMTGWDAFWMTVMTFSWLVLWGAVIYVAVKMGNRRPSGPTGHH
jgi:hypothetical protein